MSRPSRKAIDETDNRYGKLTVIKRVQNNNQGLAQWLCECDCGGKTIATGNNLRAGRTKSCGCLRRGRKALPYGQAAFNALFSMTRTNSAEHRRLEWNLTEEQFRQLTKQPCHYCGVEPRQIWGHHGSYNGTYTYNGLDRVDNSKGYLPDNVVTCCGTCNVAKMTMTETEFKHWIIRVYEHLYRERE